MAHLVYCTFCPSFTDPPNKKNLFQGEGVMKHWRIFLILAVGIIASVAFVYSCGGGGGGGDGDGNGGPGDTNLVGTWMEIESEDPCESTWDASYTYETLKFNDTGTWEAEMCPSESWSGDAWYCDVPLEDTSGTWSSYGDTLSLNGSDAQYSIADTILTLHDYEIWPCPGGDLPGDVKYGWYEGCAGGALNNLLIGDYMNFVFEYRDEGGGGARLCDVTADGVGNATANAFEIQFDILPFPGAQHLCYAINSDRTMSIGPGTAGPIVTTLGIISGDGSLLALTDADGGPTMRDVDFGVHIAKSSMAGTAGVAGNFVVGQIEGEGWVSRIGVTIDTNGTSGTWEILASENQGQVGSSGSLAFSFSSDSTFTVNVGGTVMEGIISPDRNVFAWGDTIWPRHMAVGVRMSSAGTPDGIGDYVINQMGTWAPATTADTYVSRIDLTTGIGTFDYQVTANSLGPLDSGTGIAYSVSADGTVRFPGNTGWVANLSPDGKVMVLVDADPATANDVHMGVAIKQ
jgi:hypothetical protein